MSSPEREVLEDKLTHLFLEREGTPGVYVVQVPSIVVDGEVTLYTAPCTFILDTAEWQEEFVYEKKRSSWLELDLALPALVLRERYTIHELQLAITDDLTSEDVTLQDEVAITETGELAAVGG